MEGSFFYRTEKSELGRQKMHLTVLNHYPEYQRESGEAVKEETEKQLFRIFEKYDS